MLFVISVLISVLAGIFAARQKPKSFIFLAFFLAGVTSGALAVLDKVVKNEPLDGAPPAEVVHADELF